MSLTAFEQWWALWRSQHEHADAGECVIAVRNFYETRIAALQSEQDTLWSALSDALESGKFDERLEPWVDRWHKLLDATSGEPARKP